MAAEARLESLGITDQLFPAGVHVCQIYGQDAEREEAMLSFLLSGIEAGDKTCGFTESLSEQDFAARMASRGLDPAGLAPGALKLSGAKEVYFRDGRFDPERMLNLLAAYHAASVEEGFPGARVIGEMYPEVQEMPGAERLLEYESRVSLLQHTCPVTAVCQYDARAFNGAVILDILKVHPYMVVRGSVVHNPFFIPPEEYLAAH